MLRRTLVLALSACLCLSILAGCATPTPANTPAGGSPAAVSTQAPAAKQVELTVWLESKKNDDFYKGQVEKFEAANPGITINTIVHEGDPGNDFFQGVAAGNAPDFVETSLGNIQKDAAAGIIVPLDDYFASWQDASQYDMDLVSNFKIDGKLYAIPTYGFAYYLGYNKALFAAANITTMPTTWDEMLADAQKLTDTSKGVCGYMMQAGQWTDWYFQAYVWQAGGDLTKKNDDGTIALTFTDPAVISAAKFYQNLRKAGVVQSDITLNNDDMHKQFAEGKAAMMFMAGDMVPTLVSLGMKPEDIGLMLPPAGPSGKSWVNGGIGGGYVINAKSSKDKQDAAWKWIAFRSGMDYETAYFKDQASKGPIGPIFTARKDFDISKIASIDPAWVNITNQLKPVMRPEYYGKGTFTKYIDPAIQKIIADTNSDPAAVFQAAQDQATREALNDFNTAAKK